MGTVKCIGILTSGGDAPGMNAAIRAVTPGFAKVTGTPLAPGQSIPGFRFPYVSPQFCHTAVQESPPVVHRLRLSSSP